MKKTYLTLMLFTAITATNAQTTIKKFCYVTPKQDTMILLNNDLGKSLANLWTNLLHDDKYNGKRPVIIMTDDLGKFLKKETYVDDVIATKPGAGR